MVKTGKEKVQDVGRKVGKEVTVIGEMTPPEDDTVDLAHIEKHFIAMQIQMDSNDDNFNSLFDIFLGSNYRKISSV